MRVEDYRDQSLHFFHSCAVLDRLIYDSLPLELPVTSNLSPMTMAQSLLPSEESDASLLNNIAILISRILVTHMHFFQFTFSDVATWHIQHRYYREMSSKSTVVSYMNACSMSINYADTSGCAAEE